MSSFYLPTIYKISGHAVAYWLRHYATGRKVAGSKPDDMNVFFFSLPNPSSSTKLWGSLSL
jgi:hypothetical protein